MRPRKKVDIIHLRPYEVDVTIYFNKHGDEPRFEAELGGEHLYDTDYAELRRKIGKHASLCFAADWQPIIQIKTQSPGTKVQTVAASFSFERFYYSKLGNSFRKIEWDTYKGLEGDSENKKHKLINASSFWMNAKDGRAPTDRTQTVVRTHNGENVEYKVGDCCRPYSEELWASLVMLMNTVKEYMETSGIVYFWGSGKS